MNGDADADPAPATWLRFAEVDLALLQDALETGKPAGEVCFHAQQAVEKALKALVGLQRNIVPHTHDLVALHRRVAADMRPAVDMQQLDLLTDLEAQSRYPGNWPEPTVEEAKWASEVASSVLSDVRRGWR